MTFIVDNQLPAALARFLASRGIDCIHVIDLGMANAPDSTTWKYASENGCAILTKDEDFLHFAALPGAGARLIWIRLGNCRTQVLLGFIERIWPKIEASLAAGERIIEVR